MCVMGWELRVFCPAETAKNVFDEDMVKERREDKYIVVSNRVGLKQRGKAGRWEVKIRCRESKECPGLEEWCKDQVASVETVESVLSRKGALGDEEVLGLKKQNCVTVDKLRQRGLCGRVQLEQTDLAVTVEGKTERWRSWCAEGCKDDLKIFWRENWGTREKRDNMLGESSLVMGYPEWITVVSNK